MLIGLLLGKADRRNVGMRIVFVLLVFGFALSVSAGADLRDPFDGYTITGRQGVMHLV